MTDDLTTTTTITGIAVPGNESIAITLGRIEGGQVYIKETVGDIKTTVGTISAEQSNHAILLARHGERLDQHDEILKDRAPVRHGWPIVASVVVAIVAVIASLLQSFIPHA